MNEENFNSWRRIQEVFSTVADLPIRERAKRIKELANGDLDLEKEVQSLLEFDSEKQIICNATTTDSPYKSGQQIEQFRLTFPLATGTKSEVWKAICDGESFDSAQRFAAVKILNHTNLQKRHRLRFAQEAYILSQFEHPGVVKFLAAGTTRHEHDFVATEFIDGKDIYSFAIERKLDLNSRIDLVIRVCEAIEYSHQQLVIHRDLKPDNILVDSSGQPVVIDFGISKRLQSEDIQPLQLTQTLDRPMTPAYASPEQVRGEPVSALTDVYAIGLILYQLVTGVHPYTDWAHAPKTPLFDRITSAIPKLPSALVVADKRHTNEPTTSLLEFDSPLPEEPRQLQRALKSGLQSIVMKAIQKCPDDRYQSVAALRVELTTFLSGKSSVKTAPLEAAKENIVLSLAVAMIFGILVGLIPWLISLSTKGSKTNTAPAMGYASKHDKALASDSSMSSQARLSHFDQQIQIAQSAINDNNYPMVLQIVNNLNDGSEKTPLQRFEIANVYFLVGLPQNALATISLDSNQFEAVAAENPVVEKYRHLYCLVLIQCGRANRARKINNHNAASNSRLQLQKVLIEALIREANNWFKGVRQIVDQVKSELVFAQLPAPDRNHFARLIAQYSDDNSRVKKDSFQFQDIPGAWTRTELLLAQSKKQLGDQQFEEANKTIAAVYEHFQKIGLPNHWLLARAMMLSENYGQDNFELQKLAPSIISSSEIQTPETVRLFTHLLGSSSNESDDFKRFKKHQNQWMAIDNKLYKADLLREVWRGALAARNATAAESIASQLVEISSEVFAPQQIELADALAVQSVVLANKNKEYLQIYKKAKSIIQQNLNQNSENLATGFLDAVDLENIERFVRHVEIPGFKSTPDWLFEYRMHCNNSTQVQLTMILHFVEHGSAANANEIIRLIDSTLRRIKNQKLDVEMVEDAVKRLENARVKFSSN